MLQICDTLIFFYQEKLVHGDIKPANILIGFDDNAYVGDFGTAIKLKTYSKPGELFACSDNYAVPEMLVDNVKYIESDVWSFWALIFSLPFRKITFLEIG